MSNQKQPKYRLYAAMGTEERLALAHQTGAKTALALTKIDSTLTNVLRAKEEINTFLFQARGFRRKIQYQQMDDATLLNFAMQFVIANKIEGLTKIEKLDSALCQVLRERNLTCTLAINAGFTSKGREIKARPAKAKKPPCARIKFRNMSDDELLAVVQNSGATSFQSLIQFSSSLYTELNNRPAVREQMASQGWQRMRKNWTEMNLNDWIELCSKFDSLGSFHYQYTAGYANALKSGHWHDIKAALICAGRWKSISGLDGYRYDSRAEAIVANWLYLSKIEYQTHPRLPWTWKSKRRCAADFCLVTEQKFIEVFLCTENGLEKRNDPPAWVDQYIEKRRHKEENYRARGLELISIEAEIFRYASLKEYLAHIRQAFAAHGITLADPGALKLDLGNDLRGVTWTVENFLDYAQQSGITKLSDFHREGHRDLYKVLDSRSLRDEVRLALDQRHGRHSEAEGTLLLSLDEVKTICQHRGISSLPKFQEAYKNREFPVGVPASIPQSYGMSWSEFFTGKNRADFWPFEQARDYVRKLSLKSRGEFEQRVRVDKEMRFIRRNPNNKISGGYQEFISWPDFLGKTTRSKQSTLALAA